MLEMCTTLQECELMLTGELEKSAFLGQVELPSEDVEKLGILIRDLVGHGIQQGTQYLRDYAPTCLSLFLVGLGIWKYREGNYWSAVAVAVGLEDVSWQIRWGQFFLEFLQRRDLPQFDLEQKGEGSRRYVTPILLHGGIPQHCLSDFFSCIITGLIDHDCLAEDDIKDWLYSIREQEFQKKDLYKEIEGLRKEKEKLSEDHGRLVRLENLQKKAKQLAAAASSPEQWNDLPEDCAGFLQAKESELEEVLRQIAALEKQRKGYYRKIQAFTNEDRIILELALAIEHCAEDYQVILQSRERLRILVNEEEAWREKLNTLATALWGKPWDDCYVDLIANLSWELLDQKCEDYRSLRKYHAKMVMELSAMNVNAPRLHPGFWFGVFFLPAGIGLVFLALRWMGALFISASLATLAVTYSRLREEKRLESQQKQEYEVLQCRISTAEEKLRLLEGEINQLITGLPFSQDCAWVLEPPMLDHLRSLREVFQRRQDCLCEMRQLENLLVGWERRVREIAAGAVGVSPDSGEGAMEMLLEKLSESRQRQVEAEQAGKALREEIYPKLQDLKESEKQLERDLCRVKVKLLDWGRGNLEEGIHELAIKRDASRRLREVEAEVEELAGLLGVPQDVLVGGKIGELREAKAAELENLCRRLKEREMELAGYLSPLPAVDRPIERFLLYGGDWAEKWLIGAVRLAERAFREQSVPDVVTPGLPARVVEGFREWWSKNSTTNSSGETIPETEKYPAAPALKLEQRYRGLVMGISQCRFRLDDTGTAPVVILKISASGLDDGGSYDMELPLQVYRGKGGWAETDALEFPVPLAKDYEVSLTVNGKTMRSWPISGMGEGRPFLVFKEDGRQFTGEMLPRGMLWLLISGGYTLPSCIPVIEDATPPWPAEGYQLLFVDLSDVGNFYLIDKQGKQHQAPLAETESFEPHLSGGQTIDFVCVEDAPVYAGEPPTLIIPLDDTTGLDTWSIVVRCGKELSAERKRCLLSELPGDCIRYCEGRAELPLGVPELLGPEPAGVFTVRLRMKKRIEYVFRLAVVPDLLVIFEPQLFLPVTEEGDFADLTVIVPEYTALEVVPPAEIRSLEDEAYEIAVPRGEDIVRGSLVFARAPEKTILPLTIALPSVRWRLQGLEGHKFSGWQNRVEEVWLGDWQQAKGALFLELDLPGKVVKRVQLCLNDSLQLDTKNLRNGCVRFNLLAFTDTLRSGEEALQTFSVRIYGRQGLICEGPLFRVRCRWTVEEMKPSVQDLPRVRQLRIEWRERGRVQNRVLRLWRLWEPWLPPLVEQIPDGAVQLTVERDKDLLPPGRYLAQFDVEDPWFPAEPVSFPAERFNTAEIKISSTEPYIEDLDIQVSPEETEITGTLVNATSGKKMTGLLCGVTGGRTNIWRVETATDTDGRFRFGFACHDVVPSPLSTSAHWFAAHTVDFSVYEFGILQNPAPLEFALDELPADEIAELLEMGDDVGLGVRIDCREGRLGCPVLSFEDSLRVLQARAGGCSNIEIDLLVERKIERVTLKWSEREARLRLESGVMCLGCGAILPDQQAWFDHSRGRLRDHPGLHTNYVNIPVLVQLIWDVRSLIRKCQDKYPVGWRELLVLYTSSHLPLPSPGKLDDEQLTGILWKKEKERAYMLARGL